MHPRSAPVRRQPAEWRSGALVVLLVTALAGIAAPVAAADHRPRVSVRFTSEGSTVHRSIHYREVLWIHGRVKAPGKHLQAVLQQRQGASWVTRATDEVAARSGRLRLYWGITPDRAQLALRVVVSRRRHRVWVSSVKHVAVRGRPGPEPSGQIATGVSAEYDQSCAVRSTGVVVCWGSNSDGMLGNSFLNRSPVPVAVSGLGAATAISSGVYHSCALRSTAGVVCWGYNHGPGKWNSGAVSRLSDATAISSGYAHSCALRATGSVVCWGDNSFGQLGDGSKLGTYGEGGSRPESSRPLAVSGLSDATAIHAGDFDSCAVRATGGVVCWGGLYGADEDSSYTSVPVAIPGVSDATAVTSGGPFDLKSAYEVHTCVLRLTGGVMCWGDNSEGQLGDGSRRNRRHPVAVSGLGDAIAIDAGARFSCAVRATGGVVCWGANDDGQLGNGSKRLRRSPVPVAVSGLGDATAIATGYDHACAVRATGGVVCWGRNSQGGLGDDFANGTKEDVPMPVGVFGFRN